MRQTELGRACPVYPAASAGPGMTLPFITKSLGLQAGYIQLIECDLHASRPMLNQPNWCPNIASTVTMMVNGGVHQNRRLKSLSSGFSSSRLGIKDSRAMPHFGQLPG